MNHHSRGQHGEYSIKFHSMRFLYLVVRREISEMEIFPSLRCVCVKKNPHRHMQPRPRKCDSATPEFLCLSVCAVSLNTKILQRAENDEKFSLASPTTASMGLYSFGRNDMDSCRKGEKRLSRRKCTLSITEDGIVEKLVSKWMR